MIALGKVLETERLLAEGKLSYRKIARQVGISRATVGAIASGRRKGWYDRPTTDPLAPTGPPERCVGCGSRVYLPCRACHVRKLQDDEQARVLAFRQRVREANLQRLLTAVRMKSLRQQAS